MSYHITSLNDTQISITTSRIVLRPCQHDDASALNKVFSDPEVMRYWSEPPHPLLDRTQEWVDSMVRSKQNGITDFVITLREEQTPEHSGLPLPREQHDEKVATPIGKIGVWQGDEIGFLLCKRYWGRGLATEALLSMLDYLFTHLGFQAVTADTDPRNRASIGMLKKRGFKEDRYVENTLQVGVEGGEWVDSVYLKIEKADWEKMRRRNGTGS